MPRNPTSGTGSRLLSPVRLIVPVLLSVAVLVLITVYTFEPTHFEELLGNLNVWWLGAAVASVVVRVAAGGWRLSYVSRGNLRFWDGIRAQLAWDFFSNVTPSAIGGGPVAALYIARDRRIAVGQATALMLFTMLLDQVLFAISVPLILIAAAFLDVFPASLGVAGETAFILLFLGMMVWVVVLGYAVLIRPEILQSITARLFRFRWLRRFEKRAAVEMNQLRQRSKLLRHQPASFFVNGLLMTVAVWSARFVLPLFIVLSVFGGVDAMLMFVRTIALSLGAVVLPTPGGSGGIEGLYALLLGPLMPATLVAPTLLAWRVLGYYLFIALGIYLSMHQVQQSIRRKRAHAEKETASHTVSVAEPEPELTEEL